MVEREKKVMCNYFGIGVDASVALDFHQMRERSPHLFVSRFVNKFWYTKSGMTSLLNRTDLASKVTLECDDELVTVPSDVEGIIVLNIDSFGGGSDLWGNADVSDIDEDAASDISSSDSDDDKKSNHSKSLSQWRPSMQDRTLEVVGVHGTLQLGAAQVGLYSAKRLASAKKVRITNSTAIPVQVDGEPWLFAKDGEIEITWKSQALMLARHDLEGHSVATDIVDWALHHEVINFDQRDKLMKEIARRAHASMEDLAAMG